jgi:uncharacterized protein YjbI with pentapeptide repeats
MANKEHVERLKQGVGAWNAWRRKDPGEWCDLSEADLRNRTLIGADLSAVDLSNANLRRADLSWANLREACLIEADLIGADLRRAELDGAHFSRANLRSADLRWAGLHKADLQGANLYEANLRGAELIGAELQGANLYGATLMGAKLIGASLTTTALVRADLAWADLTGCRVYGVSAWGLKLDGAKQQNLIITAENEPEITVDNIEVAQFVYLLLNNQKIRDVIDTITSKAVLILGRFSLPERKDILDKLRDELRKPGSNYVPIVFDFSVPASRNVTETINVLAGLARFVIADITDATEVRVELHSIVPAFPSLAIQPILLKGHSEFVSFPSHLKSFTWLLETFEYDGPEDLLANLDKSVIGRAEEKVLELRGKTVPQAPKS